jgi:flagellar biosynthesis/type III secretory pathway protein FliH
MEKGGCALETGFGRINGTIEDQLGMIEEEIKNQLQSAKEAPGAPQT